MTVLPWLLTGRQFMVGSAQRLENQFFHILLCNLKPREGFLKHCGKTRQITMRLQPNHFELISSETFSEPFPFCYPYHFCTSLLWCIFSSWLIIKNLASGRMTTILPVESSATWTASSRISCSSWKYLSRSYWLNLVKIGSVKSTGRGEPGSVGGKNKSNPFLAFF